MNYNYAIEEIEKFLVKDEKSKYLPKIKLSGEHSETKWIDIDGETLYAFIELLIERGRE